MPFPYSDNSSPAAKQAVNRIDTVLFDFGQVLSNPPEPAAWARMRSILGLDEDRFYADYWTFRHDYDRGTLTGSAYWHAVAARAGIALNAAQLDALFAADVDVWTDLNLPMVEWAGRLQRAGVRTGILSNIGDSIAEGIVARLPWLSGFDRCIWSYALRMAKPEPAIFLKTAETLNTAPANILFIDDREENVAAAVAVGMQAIHYTSHAAFEREMRERGFASLLGAGLAPRQSVVSSSPALDAEPTTK
jgi:putative hydrolase of the HAD superfamily